MHLQGGPKKLQHASQENFALLSPDEIFACENLFDFVTHISIKTQTHKELFANKKIVRGE
jgi:hypothetical protein